MCSSKRKSLRPKPSRPRLVCLLRGRHPNRGFGLRQACLYSIFKFHIGDEFWQQVLSVETSPRFLCALDELEHHGKGGLVRQTTFRTDRSSADIVVLSLWLRRLRASTRRSLHGSVDRNSRAGTKQLPSTVAPCGSGSGHRITGELSHSTSSWIGSKEEEIPSDRRRPTAHES